MGKVWERSEPQVRPAAALPSLGLAVLTSEALSALLMPCVTQQVLLPGCTELRPRARVLLRVKP